MTPTHTNVILSVLVDIVHQVYKGERRLLMFQIDSFSRIPVYEQIINQLEHFILTGILEADNQIPSVRNLSVSLSINPNTIQKAYAELDRNGIIYSVPGRGCFITKDAKDILSNQKIKKLANLKELVNELKLAGLPMETVITTIKEVYTSNGSFNPTTINSKEDNKND